MKLINWLNSFGRTPRRPRTNSGVPTAVERVEDRSLLSVAALFVNGELFVGSDGGDNITVRQNASARVEVLANGQILGTAPNVLTSAVTKIVVKGGDEANVINLNEVTNASYPNLTSIVIDTDDGNDFITGSPTYGDSVLAGDGADSILGQGGNDTLDGGDGNDTIVGSDGDDSLIGEDGNDSISGDLGNDTINGGDQADSITGNEGNDVINAGHNSDTVLGGDGDDLIDGSDGEDSISGEAGADTLIGNFGHDIVSGGTENDSITGGTGNDTLAGDDGDDTIRGGSGNDSVSGLLGNDWVNGEGGNDLVFGNEGDDTMYGGSGQDQLNGFLGNDRLFGQGGNDTLNGGGAAGGADSLDGGAGDDLLDSGDAIPEPAAIGISVATTTVAEGDTGTTNLIFTLSLSTPSFNAVSVTVNTADGFANAVTDYTPIVNQVVTFAPGQVTRNVTVTVATDTVNEINETVRLILSNPVNGRLQEQEAAGTIVNDDNPPIGLFSMDLNGQLSLVNPANGVTTFRTNTNTFQPIDIGSDAAGNLVVLDSQFFFGNTALVTIDTNDGSVLSSVQVTGLPFVSGFFEEGDIAFDTANNLVYVVLRGTGNPSLFRIDATTGIATTVGAIQVGTANLAANTDLVEFDYLAFRPAVAGGAAAALFGVISDGVTGTNANFNDALFQIDPATAVATRVGPLGVNLDTIFGGTANFFGGMEWDSVGNRLLLVNGGEGELFSVDPGTGAATIIGFDFDLLISGGLTLANNPAPTPANLRVSDPIVAEGDQGGISTVTFNVTRQNGVGTATVDFSTVAGTATGGGALSANIDGTTSTISLVNTQAFPAAAPYSIRIDNEEMLVTAINGNNLTVTRGTNSTVPATHAAGAIVSVGGASTTPADYAAISGSLTFTPGQTTQTVTVSVSRDFAQEADETFFLQLSNAVGAAIRDGSGSGTISNDDVFPLADTLLGGTGNDTLISGAGNDFLNGDGGADQIFGNGGNDSILGGALQDTIDGGDGDDTIDGQGGPDIVQSGNGDDTVVWTGGASGNDTVSNASGADTALVSLSDAINTVTIGQAASLVTVSEGGATLTVDSSITNVVVFTGGGNDVVNIGVLDTVTRGTLTVRGGDGNDLVTAQGINTGLVRIRMEGGNGDDSLIGGNGSDTLVGEAGIDRLRGGDGNDVAFGGASVDSINGEGGNDSLFGGDGTETLATDGSDTIGGDAGNDSIRGEGGNDIIDAGDGNDTARGGDGNDTINGGLGNDSLLGDTASDNLNGGDGNDTMDGGRNNDLLNGGAGADKMRGDHGEDTMLGGGGDDTMNGGDGNDIVNGQAGRDLMAGGDGDDYLNGDGDNDTISGGDGDDSLLGGDGNDIVLGDQGDDVVNGQASTDTIAGGQGDDTIIAAVAGEVIESFTLSAQLLAALSAT